MKQSLLCFLVAFPHLLHAQTFAPVPLPVEGNLAFEGVRSSSVAFADVDGDNDQDLLISGENSSFVAAATLYINDGNGVFAIRKDTPFKVARNSLIAFADIDGDSDQDLLISGENSSGVSPATLYANDGNGVFAVMNSTSFEEESPSSIAFVDIDGDYDQDILIAGENSSFARTATIYTNDGNGTFTIMSDTPFEGTIYGSIAFADIDGDNDQDFLLIGQNSSSTPSATLYTNDGKGAFTLMSDSPFEGVHIGSIAFADIDGDNDQDVLITGRNSSNAFTAKLYTNDGNGVFTITSNTPFEGVIYSSVAFADIDRDNDQDLLITGNGVSHSSIAKLYINDGSGAFTIMNNTPFKGVNLSSIAFSDVDGDNDQDILITGQNSSHAPTATLYTNMLNISAVLPPLSASPIQFPQLFPNPSVNVPVTLSYSAEKFGELSIAISDAAGKTLLRHQIAVSEGENTIPLDCADLPKGTYIVELKQGDRSTSTKLVIQ